jgi:integrase
MASLQARHSRGCALERPWTTFAEQDGCDCAPAYYVVHRHAGRLVRDPVGPNRKDAQRALDARKGELAERRYRTVRDVRFDAWADEWLASLTTKQSTKAQYRMTLALAADTFGRVKLRDLTTSDVQRFLAAARDRRSVTEATLAKHLRHLGACLQAAVVAELAERNPVRLLHKSSKPRPAKTDPSYFTDDELARLWPELAGRPLMLALCKTAVGTGARLGELSALTWDDVALVTGELHVRRGWSDGYGEDTPKSGQARTVDLTPPAVSVLAQWYADSAPGGLVFELETGSHISSRHADPALYRAMKRAGIPRVGEAGRKRTFHSLRHTFARIALEGGAEITWVKEQLGHSSITLTVDLYGRWSRTARKAQAERLAGAFRL